MLGHPDLYSKRNEMNTKYHSADDIARLNKETQKYFADRDRLAQAELRGISEQAGECSTPERIFDMPNAFFVQCHAKRLNELADELALYDLEAAEAVESDILALSLFTCQLQAHNRREQAAHVGNAEGLMRSREHLVEELADTARRGGWLRRGKSSDAQHAAPSAPRA